jgi:hypothetical protein
MPALAILLAAPLLPPAALVPISRFRLTETEQTKRPAEQRREHATAGAGGRKCLDQTIEAVSVHSRPSGDGVVSRQSSVVSESGVEQSRSIGVYETARRQDERTLIADS